MNANISEIDSLTPDIQTVKGTICKIRTKVNIIFDKLISNIELLEEGNEQIKFYHQTIEEGILHHKKTISNLTIGKHLR